MQVEERLEEAEAALKASRAQGAEQQLTISGQVASLEAKEAQLRERDADMFQQQARLTQVRPRRPWPRPAASKDVAPTCCLARTDTSMLMPMLST